MTTQEDRITRIEAIQETNAQQSAEVLARLNQLFQAIEASRQESREMNEIARREAREMNDATRKETREMVEAARRDARNLFIAAFTVGAGLGGGLIALLFRLA